MLSVLVPVYNFDIRELIKTLSNQALKSKKPFEIIVVDDASDLKFKKINHVITSYKGVVYSEEPENIGRSKIRNKLASLAKFKYLLFLDCDSAVASDKFIANYFNNANKAPVIYGGTIYGTQDDLQPKFILHWLHGIKREQSKAKERNVQPNRSFKTNNFFIEKEVLNKVLFNENIKGYGHEDTLFGYELDKQNFTIYHIDNPVVHLGLESSEVFIRKTREGIENLQRIMVVNGNEKRLIKDVTLLSYYKRLQKLRLEGCFRHIFSRMELRLKKNLLSKKPSLFYFDLYKLGYLCSLKEKIK